MRILLVRHGESQANIDQSLHRTIPDHEIALSSRGQVQARKAAEEIYRFYIEKYGEGHCEHWSQYGSKILNFWNSPYRRTRDTSDIIARHLPFKKNVHRKEEILLCEQQFGLFDGLEDDEIEERFPEEFATWKRCKEYNGKFWARYPMGESPFDAAIRIKQFFEDIYRDARSGVNENIVVCHGTVVKLFVMMWFRYSPEWFADERTIGNCGIYCIQDDIDKGWFFSGYKKGKPAVRT